MLFKAIYFVPLFAIVSAFKGVRFSVLCYAIFNRQQARPAIITKAQLVPAVLLWTSIPYKLLYLPTSMVIVLCRETPLIIDRWREVLRQAGNCELQGQAGDCYHSRPLPWLCCSKSKVAQFRFLTMSGKSGSNAGRIQINCPSR